MIMTKDQFMTLPNDFLNQLQGVSPDELYDRLYITAFRYDPCFPMVGSELDPFGPTCVVRAIRLVGQFIDMKTGTVAPSTMHILYAASSPAMTPEQDFGYNMKIINSLKQLKKASAVETKGVKLGVHPGFTGPNRAQFQDVVTGIVKGFASDPRFFFATSIFYKVQKGMYAANRDTEWKWSQHIKNQETGVIALKITSGTSNNFEDDFGRFKLSENGDATTIPGPKDLRFETGDDRRADERNPLFFPIPRLQPVFNQFTPSQEVAAAIHGADVYENPSMLTIPAGDCAGCHAVTQRRLNAEKSMPNVGERTRRFKAYPGITNEMDDAILARMSQDFSGNADNNILINFGYHTDGKAVISQRTVNAASMVTLLLNKKMLDGQWKPE